ncbi:MAG: DUF5671 domain-containing protein [Paracoccus sp. (in: a-proteobacteria)]|nr:DUF5671 domain-containing protein [Paracoccus sp. (in: a-proteobacteria)]
MRPSEPISEFVRAALQSGRDPAEVEAALAQAGWSEQERSAALGAWMTQPGGLPPVPRPQPYVSAREALIYGLLFITLVAVAWNLCDLGFRLVDRLLPDGDYPPYYWRGDMRWQMASLIAFTPVFLFLNSRIQRRSRNDQGVRRSLVRKWFASITLLISVIVLLGDLVYTIYALLNGDMTLRFTLKALIVAGVAGLVIAYYRDELDE